MDKEQIVKAFDDFVDKKYSDGGDVLRTSIRKEINDHLKTKLNLKNDPIEFEDEEKDKEEEE